MSYSIDAASVPLEQLPEAVAELRATFYSGKTRSIAFRKKQLEAFLRMLTEGEAELANALKQDLGKSTFEGFLTEIGQVMLETRYMIDHVEELSQPKPAGGVGIEVTPGRGEIVSDPLGVVLVMGAWNYPVNLSLVPVVGAIAAGNTVLLRPGHYSQHSSNAMARLFKQYLDPTCYKVVEGDRHCTSACLKEKYDLIFFTGGTFVGRLVAEAAARNLTPTVLEMGGKSPCIVDRSCNLDMAANRIVWGKFTNCGQTCIAPDFMLLDEKIADEFLALIKTKINNFYGQNPNQSEWFARIINARAHKRLSGVMQESKQYAVHGGAVDAKLSAKDPLFLPPSIYDFGNDEDAFLGSGLMKDEIFGPLLPVFRYSSVEQVLSICQNREKVGWKPLVLYLFANNVKIERRLKRETTSGGMVVNDCLVHIAQKNLPFGGVGFSGMGSYHGHKSWLTFTHQKSVLIRPTYGDIPIRYPPFTKDRQNALRLLYRLKMTPRWKMQIIKWVVWLVGAGLSYTVVFPFLLRLIAALQGRRK